MVRRAVFASLGALFVILYVTFRRSPYDAISSTARYIPADGPAKIAARWRPDSQTKYGLPRDLLGQLRLPVAYSSSSNRIGCLSLAILLT